MTDPRDLEHHGDRHSDWWNSDYTWGWAVIIVVAVMLVGGIVIYSYSDHTTAAIYPDATTGQSAPPMTPNPIPQIDLSTPAQSRPGFLVECMSVSCGASLPPLRPE